MATAIAPTETEQTEVVESPSSSVSLYRIEDDLRAMLDSADLVAPEDEEAYKQDLFELITMSLAKRDSVARYISSLEMAAFHADQEIARLRDRKEAFKRREAAIRKYLVSVIQQSGGKQLQGKTSTITVCKLPDVVEILDESLIPAEFIQVKQPEPVRTPMKDAIKLAIRNGREVDGARLHTGRQTCRIT